MMLKIFWNFEESRLRAGWRAISVFAIMAAIFIPLQIVLRPILKANFERGQQIDILLAILAVIITVTIWAVRKYIDKRDIESLGMGPRKGMTRDIIAGFGISATLVAVVVLIEMGFGWLTIEVDDLSISTQLYRVTYLLVTTGLVVSWWENLFFVSYLWLNVKDGLGPRTAFILISVLAGITHGANPNATIWGVLGIMLIHSYEIYAFLRTKNLWLVFGIHAGWNFTQGLSGFNVSGQEGTLIVTQTNTTPGWVGGGDFGPEAGLVVILTTIIAYAMITIYTAKVADKPEETGLVQVGPISNSAEGVALENG